MSIYLSFKPANLISILTLNLLNPLSQFCLVIFQILSFLLSCSFATVLYSALQCSTVLYSALQYSTVLYTLQCSTVLYSALRCSTVLYTPVLFSALQCSTVLYTPVLFSALQCSTVLYTLQIQNKRIHFFSSKIYNHKKVFYLRQIKENFKLDLNLT